MARESLLQTKLIPPRPHHHSLHRQRLLALLQEALDFRLTIIQASTGYGKSTALAQLAATGIPVCWYTVGEGDSDPHEFLAHLVGACHLGVPGLDNGHFSALSEDSSESILVACDTLLNTLNSSITTPTLLVIDDYHFAGSAPVNELMDHLLGYLPRDLHAIVATRYPPQWEHLPSWRVHGQVLDVKRNVLAFTRDEIDRLFAEQYGMPLPVRDQNLLFERTEGWPIALEMVWQQLRADRRRDVGRFFATSELGPASLDTLFTYLAKDVLARQSSEMQVFLIETGVLRELDSGACDAVTGGNSSQMFAQLCERDLLLVALGDDHYRYHHLFREFLYAEGQRRDRAQVSARHKRAAQHYQAVGNVDEAVYHLLSADAWPECADLIERLGDSMLRAGRLATLSGWIDELPSAIVGARSLLVFYRGEIARLRSRFDEAVGWYKHSETMCRTKRDTTGIVRALRGQALVYLDTIGTPIAQRLLEEALQLVDRSEDREARARVLELMAQNKLNMGRTEEAQRLRGQANGLLEDNRSEDALSVRVKLQTGRLKQARTVLETWVSRDDHPPMAHIRRETPLLLSLIYAAQGCAEQAFMTARRAVALGEQLDSPLVSLMGELRLGHAYQLRGQLREALSCYEHAIEQGEQFTISRVRVEARWGMTRAHALLGNIEAARMDADEGIEVGRQAGDLWAVSQVQLALGASYVLSQQYDQAIETLAEVLLGFDACDDTFGSAAAWMWIALAAWKSNQQDQALQHLEEALSLSQTYQYDYLLTGRTLLGWQDPCVLVPLLLAARGQVKHSGYLEQLLSTMGMADATSHPGYQLRIQTLGALRVWRGSTLVPRTDWQRKKARQLLELLVTYRGRMLGREEIYELLWRDETPEAAARDFKVALNALNKVLEPDRAGDEPPAFVQREEASYGLAAGINVWVDADEFVRLVEEADGLDDPSAALDLYRHALALYLDDYLKLDAPYEDWALVERERLQTVFFRAADRLATGLLERGELAECEGLCQRILTRDRCWEHAYRLQMQAAARRGNVLQARRVFDECRRVLQEDLHVEPSPITFQLLQELSRG